MLLHIRSLLRCVAARFVPTGVKIHRLTRYKRETHPFLRLLFSSNSKLIPSAHIIKKWYAGAEDKRVNIQTDFVDQTCLKERFRQLASSHRKDAFPILYLYLV